MFDPLFELVKQHVDELISALLLAGVDGAAVKVLLGEAEIGRVVELPVG